MVDQGRLTTVDLPVLVEKTNRMAARLVGDWWASEADFRSLSERCGSPEID